MKTWSFYAEGDGLFVGRSFFGPDDSLEANTPSGCGAIEGLHDYLSRKVDLSSGAVVDYLPIAPVDTSEATFVWNTDTMRWESTPTLAALRRSASAAIDAAAGAARLRYITDVPGQSAVYLVKAEQAAAYQTVSFSGTPPPYVSAEATALGVSAQAAAEGILAVAAVWNDQAGPAIEGIRIGAKNAVNADTDATAIAATLAQAIAQLASA